MIHSLVLYFFICNFLLIFINFFLKKNKFLLYKKNSSHKIKFKKEIYLSGGIYLFFTFIFIFVFYNKNYTSNYNFILYSSLFLILGIISDLKKNFSAPLRLIIFFILCFFCITHSQIFIKKIDIKILDFFLEYNILSIIFFSLCLNILINGSNFIDGTHGNALLYYILVYSSILIINLIYNNLNNEINIILIYIIITLFTLYIYNFNVITFLGDGGAYFMGAFTGFFFIYIYNKFNLNSLYICNLLIYPAFEVLWSIIRKKINNQNTFNADKMHLHNLILIFLNIKIKEYNIASNLTSLIIFFLNGIFFYLVSQNISEKSYQIKMLSIYILFYIILYFLLNSLLKKR
jgi:UDP-N-acetylmuramyl pentapeptide phosphotransferase/UDP-N-acetylglucosamine-1-phosphate transferase